MTSAEAYQAARAKWPWWLPTFGASVARHLQLRNQHKWSEAEWWEMHWLGGFVSTPPARVNYIYRMQKAALICGLAVLGGVVGLLPNIVLWAMGQ